MPDVIQLTYIDYGLMVLIALGLPIKSFWAHKRFERKLIAGDKTALMATYKESMWLLWLPTILVVAYWIFEGRSFDALGLSISLSMAEGVGLAVTLVISALLTAQVFQVRGNKEAAEGLMKEVESAVGVEQIMPKTPTEYSFFKVLSITAGITEEVLFRGYLIWAFGYFMHSAFAAVVSLAVFVLAHVYQGSKLALLKVAATGAFITLLYMLSGSLFLAIILHAVIDLTSGASCWHARRLTVNAT